jgi:hypothetical protein
MLLVYLNVCGYLLNSVFVFKQLGREKQEKPITHIYSKLILNILDHKDALPRNEIPPDIAQVLRYQYPHVYAFSFVQEKIFCLFIVIRPKENIYQWFISICWVVD